MKAAADEQIQLDITIDLNKKCITFLSNIILKGIEIL